MEKGRRCRSLLFRCCFHRNFRYELIMEGINIDTIVSMLTISGMLAGWFYFLVIKPLQTSIGALRDVVLELKSEMSESMKDRRNISERLSTTENAVKDVYKHIDKICIDIDRIDERIDRVTAFKGAENN